MSNGRKARRADGTLRPSVARHRARRRLANALAYDLKPENAAWVALFAPGDRERFLRHSKFWQGRGVVQTAREADIPIRVAALALEIHAADMGWMVLRKADGEATMIAPRLHARAKPDRTVH